jgi:hypothetical protein
VGIPPVSFLRDKRVAPGQVLSRALPWRHLEQVTDDALQHKLDAHPITTLPASYHGLHHLAAELKVSPDRLYKFCPELLATLDAARGAREEQEKEQRRNQLTCDAQAAVHATHEASRKTGKPFSWGLYCSHLIRGGRCMNEENLALVRRIFFAAKRRLIV